MDHATDTISTRVDVERLALSPGQVARAMGYPPDAVHPQGDVLQDLITTQLSEAIAMIAPKFVYRLGRVEPRDADAIVVTTTQHQQVFHVGSTILSQLRGSTRLAVFVVTIGDEVETAARQRMRDGQVLEGYLLDAIGSVAAEAAADAMHASVSQYAQARQWNVTNRFSPGYCEWTTAEQTRLFRFLHDVSLPVCLTGSHVMQPMKSVSGLIGLGPGVERHPYPCAFCRQEDCHARMDAHGTHSAPGD